MQSKRIAALAATAALASCHPTTDEQPASTPASATLSSRLDCSGLRPVVDVGSWPLVFVPNAGQDHADVAFQGLSLQAGTLSFSADGVRLDLAPIDGARPAAAASLTLRHAEGQGELQVDAASALPGRSTWHFSDGRRVETPQYGGLVGSAGSGIQAAYGGTARRLDVTYTVAPGAASRLRWSYDGVQAIQQVHEVGSLELTLDGAGPRTASLGPPEAWQDIGGQRVPVQARYALLEGGTVGLTFGAHNTKVALHVRTQLLHSPYFREYSAASAEGRTLVAASSWQVAPGVGDSGRDAFVAAVDAQTGALAFSTFFVGQGDDEGGDVSVSEDGEVLVVGTTGSDDFPTVDAVQPDRAGGTDGFIAVLDSEGGELIRATYLGGSGEDRVTGVLASAEHGVLVSGIAGEELEEVSADQAHFTTVLPHPDSSPYESRFFLTALDPQLSGVTTQVVFDGPSDVLPRLARDCDGNVLVGVFFTTAMNCDAFPDLTYSMRQHGKNYAMDHDFFSPPPGAGSPPGGWGFHALRWRFYDANDPASPLFTPGGVTVSWAAASTPAIPKTSTPNGATAQDLNDLEASPVFNINPKGGWTTGWTASVDELALEAATAEWKYGTPVYTLRRERKVDGSFINRPMGIEKVTFDVCVNTSGHSYSGQGLETLCDFANGWPGVVSCNPAFIGGAGFSISVSKFEASGWTIPVGWFYEHSMLDPYPTYSWQQWYVQGDWVGDPPDDEPLGMAQIDEAASQLSALTTRQVQLVQTDYQGGAPVGSAQGPVHVRSRDLR